MKGHRVRSHGDVQEAAAIIQARVPAIGAGKAARSGKCAKVDPADLPAGVCATGPVNKSNEKLQLIYILDV